MLKESIMPIYVALDISESMGRSSTSREGKTRIDIASSIIPTLLEAMRYDSTFAESVRITVLGFNEDVTVIAKQADYNELENVWNRETKKIKDTKDGVLKSQIESRCIGQTYYNVLFRRLKTLISEDVSEIIRSGKQYYRPLVYFLTDGDPYGDNKEVLKEEYKKLVTNRDDKERYNPVILCIGTGESTFAELSRYGAGRNYRANKPNYNSYRYSNNQYAWLIKKDVDEKKALGDMNALIISAIKNSLIPDDINAGTVSEIDLEANIGKIVSRPRVNKRLNEVFETEHIGSTGR